VAMWDGAFPTFLRGVGGKGGVSVMAGWDTVPIMQIIRN